MKRLFLLMAVILATALTATAQTAPKRHGWSEEFSLYGDVESVEIITYELEEHDGELFYNEPKNTEVYEFNMAGDVVKSVCYSNDGNVIYQTLYDYNSIKKCSAITKYDSRNKPTSKCKYLYDSNGRLTEIHRYNSDGDFYQKEIYSYDQNGNKTQVENQSPDGTLEFGQFYTYSYHNNLIKEIQYDSNRFSICEITYEYDWSDKKTEEVTHFYNDNSEIRRTYEYNVYAKLYMECLYGTDGSLTHLSIRLKWKCC